jgi:hypothetical protein
MEALIYVAEKPSHKAPRNKRFSSNRGGVEILNANFKKDTRIGKAENETAGLEWSPSGLT